jgi:transcriptional regulator with XRE-family HTH domain
MSNLPELSNTELGQRLAELRKTVAQDLGLDLTQENIAKQLNVTNDVISRLEKGKGKLESLLKLLLFYHQKGYNILWVLIPDNKNMKKYGQSDMNTNPEVLHTLEKLNSLLKGGPKS